MSRPGTTAGITEDYCRCGHVASHHAEGEGGCRACQASPASIWAPSVRCHRFRWSETWQLAPGAA